jgi:hypothetical protein
MRQRKSTARAATLAMCVGIGALFAPSAAGAGDRQPLPPEEAVGLPSTSNVGLSWTGVGQTDILIGGVGGCYGQTDDPHRSHHVGGTANVVARTVCPATDYVYVALYRSRWYGWEFRDDGQQTRFGSAQANAARGCAGTTHTWLGSSYHEATGVGYAYTSNSRRFAC